MLSKIVRSMTLCQIENKNHTRQIVRICNYMEKKFVSLKFRLHVLEFVFYLELIWTAREYSPCHKWNSKLSKGGA